MKITLDEWLSLEELVNAAAAALRKLDSRLIELSVAHMKESNNEEALLLVKLSNRVSDAESDLAANLYVVQSEWTGGPSDDPRNFTLREPNWVNIAHRFPREQVDKYRDSETGNINITHRKKERNDRTENSGQPEV